MGIISIFLWVIFLSGFLTLVYYMREYIIGTLDYKDSKRTELKRRLQAEAKFEQETKMAIEQVTGDDKLKLLIKSINERHQRQLAYVIHDVFERNQ